MDTCYFRNPCFLLPRYFGNTATLLKCGLIRDVQPFKQSTSLLAFHAERRNVDPVGHVIGQDVQTRMLCITGTTATAAASEKKDISVCSQLHAVGKYSLESDQVVTYIPSWGRCC